MNCRPKIQKIDEWWDKGWLADTFYRACGEVSGGVVQSFFFSNIYAPTLKWNTDKSQGPKDPTEWEWKNYGFSQQEVADAYWSQFGWCYFPEYFESDAEQAAALASEKSKVYRLIHAVLIQNKMKYQKMIDLAGFAYDPLNNVDAHEMHSEFEVHGDEEHKQASALSNAGQNTTLNTHAVSTYDGDAKTEYTDSVSVPAGTTPVQPGATIIMDGTTVINVEGVEVQRPNDVSSGVSTGYDKLQHETAKNGINDSTYGTDYHVAAKDNAFGQELKGADRYRAEKNRRYGNIGVTKTQELLEAERENLRFNLLQEFFRDINKVVLIGVY